MQPKIEIFANSITKCINTSISVGLGPIYGRRKLTHNLDILGIRILKCSCKQWYLNHKFAGFVLLIY